MENNNPKTNDPITKKEEVQQSNDEHIDQDFKGFPHAHAKEEIINPKKKVDKLIADVEKNTQITSFDEAASDGSGGAFGATENVGNDDDDYIPIDEK
ncbi:hypothetical protein FRZ67_03825 [Panacibacter ginsenosidivorans]|uniref:Uncharacterized protein n=1 Tax=Panacibacter ginsenosidivorans TaxID=1813871 RepID=A0A5B8V6F8_9BACT|nr:hypothetical protein [Panacibacter ginsenosidivorans]QEC66463.1 hypothetical protein FRZ67_03825 [Panacibacter ginsenosidivorans]